ncbi:MAG: ECF transporter S component [Anaerolineae bacterium]|nr:ECF transporter S component [Anaerolineae bacterium]
MQKRYYFSTRDLLMMAALAALGGVTSTYINALGDAVQSMLGFAGTTQWAAGLHVLWLTLAMGLTGKAGAGTITGLLKGAVELMSGNTHGLLVVLVDVVAGILVDVGFLPFRNRDRFPAYALAGGLASASNVFVFQLFAALPADILAYGALLLVGGMAFLSGVLFAGLLSYTLLGALRRAGVVKDQATPPLDRRIVLAAIASAVVLTGAFALYLRGALRGPVVVQIGGAVTAPYAYPQEHSDLASITAESTLRDVSTRYTGIPVRDLVEQAQPASEASLLLVQAVDGYAFFISMDEVRDNGALLLASQGQGQERTYDVVGAENSKAWVRGVSALTVTGAAQLEVNGTLQSPTPFDPDVWQFEMDSIPLDLGDGARKVQGAPLGLVLQAMQPQPEAKTVQLHTSTGTAATLSLQEVLDNDDIRIFTLIDPSNVTFAVANMDGTVIAADVIRITVE